MVTISLENAARAIQNGELVAVPTETVYGLAANAYDDKAVASVYAAKGRPEFNPLIIHFSNAELVAREVEWSDAAEKLSATFWPGPLTMVLRRRKDSRVSLLASAGLDTLAVRIPNHPITRGLIDAAGVPLAAPSANRSGRVSPTTAAHVKESFGDAIPVIDGGACVIGLESTVIDLTQEKPTLLRPGAVTREELSNALGREVIAASEHSAILAPGMLKSHYAPEVSIRLNAVSVREGEALLAFGSKVPEGAVRVLNLSLSGDLKEAAANVFAYIRALDKPDYSAIAVMPIPNHGLGIAINDRLSRAASRN